MFIESIFSLLWQEEKLLTFVELLPATKDFLGKTNYLSLEWISSDIVYDIFLKLSEKLTWVK